MRRSSSLSARWTSTLPVVVLLPVLAAKAWRVGGGIAIALTAASVGAAVLAVRHRSGLAAERRLIAASSGQFHADASLRVSELVSVGLMESSAAARFQGLIARGVALGDLKVDGSGMAWAPRSAAARKGAMPWILNWPDISTLVRRPLIGLGDGFEVVVTTVDGRTVHVHAAGRDAFEVVLRSHAPARLG